MAKKTGLSTGQWTLIGIAVVLVLGALWLWSSYNSLVRLDENVNNQWAQVETVMQRRADLIPNLVATVKGFAKQELSVFTDVTAARSAWASAGTINEKAQAATSMESALSRLLVTVEAYPELKSDKNFMALQDELANTENKISVERKRYNDAVTPYNRKIRMFPTNMIAGMFGFDSRVYFEASEGADTAPVVDFE